jgi:catechol 2,3-dioxygenase
LAGSAGFFSSNGYHHHIGANIWRSRHGRPSPAHRAGLARVVFAVASPSELADLAARLRDEGHRAEEGAAGSLVVADPDGMQLVFALDDSARKGS